MEVEGVSKLVHPFSFRDLKECYKLDLTSHFQRTIINNQKKLNQRMLAKFRIIITEIFLKSKIIPSFNKTEDAIQSYAVG